MRALECTSFRQNRTDPNLGLWYYDEIPNSRMVFWAFLKLPLTVNAAQSQNASSNENPLRLAFEGFSLSKQTLFHID